MARLMLSAGMLAARADSVAAFRRRLPLGSPPPFFAATVISRRIFENSFPRCTSVLPFLRLICDHREWPDIALSSLVRNGDLVLNRSPKPLHALQAHFTSRQGGGPSPPLAGGFGRER